ncbi:cache domain-containing sensor histidine kinase [Paenibacillus sinopodophylli]|uniref:cache domain-containing sensor histidine kinase n=1 Tax=Paenibacillus sinopodophylli TaxID=1837342 RepID=UPI001486A5F3|nr:sensor histidine kinase [Paenibacillus sinopodophylli]
MMTMFKFRSFGTRLFLLFSACSFCLLIVFSLSYSKRSTEQINSMLGDAAYKNVSQAREHVELLLKGYDSLSRSIVTNTDIQRLLGKKEPNSAVKAINERTITNALGSIYYSWDDVLGIHLFNLDHGLYSYGSSTQVIDPEYASRAWYEQIKQSAGETVWIGMRQHSVIDQNEQGSVFIFGRKLTDLHKSHSIGMVLIEIKPNALQTILSNMNVTDHTISFLAESDQIIAHLDVSLLQSEPSVTLPMIENATSSRFVAGDEQIVVSKLSTNNWYAVSLTPISDLTVEINTIQRLLTGLTIGLLVVSLVFALLVSVTFTAPLKQLMRHMRLVGQGKFEEVPVRKSFKETELLTEGFNQMVRRINELIEWNNQVSESEKIAQLNALQSQVNPHFLYNTLDMVYWMLDEKDNEYLGNVVLALSSIFRYSSDWSNGSSATLGEEMEQIRRYALITQARFGDKLKFEFEGEEYGLDLTLPKMTLQPIVENAVIHGIGHSGSGGVVRISVARLDQLLVITIEDNGIGIAPEKVDVMNEMFENSVPLGGRSGVGLANVHRRLAYRFGTAYGLSVRSAVGQGSQVIITLPFQGTRRADREAAL